MAKTFIDSSNLSGPTSTANTTEYWTPISGPSVGTTTEAQAEIKVRSAGILSALYVRVGSVANGGTHTLRTRKNGANGGQSVTINATGVFEDTTNTDTLASTDTFCYQSTPSGSTNTFTWWIISNIFNATTDSVSFLNTWMQTSQATASTNWFFPLTSRCNNNITTETFQKCRLRKAGTLKNVGVRSQTNRATTTNIRLRKNGANANSIAAVTGGGAAGWYEDTTNTDSVTAGDDWNFVLTTGTGTDTLQLNNIKAEFVSTSGDGLTIAGDPQGITTNDNTTAYQPLGGRNVDSTTENSAKTKARVAFDFSQLNCMISANDVSSASTFVFRKSGVDGTQTMSITGSITGLFGDTTHTDSVATTDDVYAKLVVPSVAGTHSVTMTESGINTHTVNDLSRDLSESSISVSDSITRAGTFSRTVSESSTSVSDSISRSIALPRTISETATAVSDAINRTLGAFRKVGTGFSLLFDGVNDNLNCGDQSDLWSQGLDKFSFSFWIYTTTGWDGQTRYAVSHGGSVPHRFLCYIDASTANRINFECRNSASSLFAARSLGFNLSVWNHITCVYDNSLGSANVKIYLNKTVGGTTANLTETLNISTTLYLSSTPSLSNGFQGSIKDFRFWKSKALTQTEINDVCDNLDSAPAPDYWLPMREGTGTPVDSIGAKTTSFGNETGWSNNSPDNLIYEKIIVSDSVTKSLTLTRLISDAGVTVNDALNTISNVFRSLNDSASSGDSLARTYGANSNPSDTTNVSDQLDRSVTNVRAMNESTSVGDSLNKLIEFFRSLPENISSGEFLTRSVSNNKTINEASISVSDQLDRGIAFFRSLPETTGISDAINRILGFFRSPSETVTVSDAVDTVFTPGGGTNFDRPLSESVSVGDQVDRSVSNTRDLTESVPTSDNVSRAAVMTRALADAVGVTDLVNRTYDAFRTLSDSVNTTDSVNKILEFFRSLSDAVGITDSVNRSAISNRNLSESVPTDDQVQRSVDNTRALSESVSTNDTVDKVTSFFRNLSESVGITDVVNKAADMLRSLLEVVGVTDNVTRQTQGQISVFTTDIPIIINKWIEDNWTDDPISTVEYYLIPPKSKITFGTRFDMSAGSHSDMHIHVRNVHKNVTSLSTDATVQENSAIVNLYVEVRYIPDTPPDFSGDTAGAPSDMMWQIRSYIDELIRSNPEQLYDAYGIEVISIMQELPDSNTPADVHAQNVIENMYQIIFTLKCFWTLKVDRQA
jgi:hypothetical protein